MTKKDKGIRKKLIRLFLVNLLLFAGFLSAFLYYNAQFLLSPPAPKGENSGMFFISVMVLGLIITLTILLVIIYFIKHVEEIVLT